MHNKDWEEMFASHISNKGCGCKIYKEMLQLSKMTSKNGSNNLLYFSPKKMY